MPTIAESTEGWQITVLWIRGPGSCIFGEYGSGSRDLMAKTLQLKNSYSFDKSFFKYNYSYASMKGGQTTGDLQPSEEKIQYYKTLHFFNIFLVLGT